MEPLTDLEREVLTFAKQQWRFTGSRAVAIREAFDWTESRYFQVLNEVIDRPAALAAEPTLVKRLQRLRRSRLTWRVA